VIDLWKISPPLQKFAVEIGINFVHIVAYIFYKINRLQARKADNYVREKRVGTGILPFDEAQLLLSLGRVK
jgi:hypothetical protein